MIKKMIKKFKSQINDGYLVIGADANINSDYINLKNDVEEGLLDFSAADIDALEDYLNFGENGDGTVNSRLLSELNFVVGLSFEN